MKVCVLGYVIIGVALLLCVQAQNVFPQLLLVRLLFSIGGAASSTMVTAILPTMIASRSREGLATITPSLDNGHTGHNLSPSISSESTITPLRLRNFYPHKKLRHAEMGSQTSPTRLAGLVGLFTGCGALIALGLFLRLPELIQRTGVDAGEALANSYYIVGALALILSLICFVGLRNLNGEQDKGWRVLMYGGVDNDATSNGGFLLLEAVMLGFRTPTLGLGYLGGFVARASSVGISLFIPLFVNAYYMYSGLCDDSGHEPSDIKEHCRGAYVLAAQLTGASQLAALLFAPIFGLVADRYQHFNIPLLIAALVGVLGYLALAILNSPATGGEHGTLWIFAIMALLGISQIGAIVCSLGLLGRCVLGMEARASTSEAQAAPIPASMSDPNVSLAEHPDSGQDSEPLLPKKQLLRTHEHLKGSIAGVYSLAGGAGILLLTKLGGVLFDSVSPAAPFYMLSLFNAFLLAAGIGCAVSDFWKTY